mmetsp:Transcript_83209/g.147006  ORF Transcript_83209/g.147006 Transcript_83209/m.147006 type:complete len:101 (+) Transcript_83209:241-543(+)
MSSFSESSKDVSDLLSRLGDRDGIGVGAGDLTGVDDGDGDTERMMRDAPGDRGADRCCDSEHDARAARSADDASRGNLAAGLPSTLDSCVESPRGDGARS